MEEPKEMYPGPYKDSDFKVILETRVQKAFWSVAKQYPCLDIWIHSFEWLHDCGENCEGMDLTIIFCPKGCEEKAFCKDDEKGQKLEAEVRKKIELAMWEIVKENPSANINININDSITSSGEDCIDLDCNLYCSEREIK